MLARLARWLPSAGALGMFSRRGPDDLRLQLSRQEGQLVLATLGLATGLLAGLVILAFRVAIESVQAGFLPGGNPEAYEGLSALTRFLLAAGGGVLLAMLFQMLPEGARYLGVVHVMERFAYHQGKLPVANAVTQFIGGALSIIAGHSVGREGPGIHLGGAAGSALGQGLRLPNNSVRTLVACGVAASIGASFNTPLAGVALAMEVVLMEYTLAGFAPVILAAVSGTAVTRLYYGSDQVFNVPAIPFTSLAELGWVFALGLMMALLAALFARSLVFFSRLGERWPVWVRLSAAGLVTGAIGALAPETMGIGYDSVNAALLGEATLAGLILLAGAKLLATTAGVGLGLPGGLIGPTLVVGAAAGGAFGLAAEHWVPGATTAPGLYALIGMGAMMAATLQAPLAALTAMLELTGNPQIILPGMLALVSAALVTREPLRTESVFILLLRARGLDYVVDPVTQSLHRLGVSAAMDRSFELLPPLARLDEVRECLNRAPEWILVRDGDRIRFLLSAADVARAVEDEVAGESISLPDIPAQRFDVAGVPMEATLHEALVALRSNDTEALYVERRTAPGIARVYGVLTREAVERTYRV